MLTPRDVWAHLRTPLPWYRATVGDYHLRKITDSAACGVSVFAVNDVSLLLAMLIGGAMYLVAGKAWYFVLTPRAKLTPWRLEVRDIVADAVIGSYPAVFVLLKDHGPLACLAWTILWAIAYVALIMAQISGTTQQGWARP